MRPSKTHKHDMMNSGKGGEAAIEMIRSVGTGTTPKAMMSKQLARSVWQNYTGIAERYNEPGRFTALIGYEWTSNNGGNNLHRVVIFRDGKDKADQIVPFSAFDSEDPAMLWKFLDAYHGEDRRRRCSPSRTTAICPTGACSRWSISTAAG